MMRGSNCIVIMLLNVMLMGMMGYMYLLWVQYRNYIARTTPIEEFSNEQNLMPDLPLDDIHMRKGRPRIKPRLRPTPEYGLLYPEDEELIEATTKISEPTPHTTLSAKQLDDLIENHKMKMTVQLRTFQIDGGNLLFQHENQYGVKYKGEKDTIALSKEKIECSLKKATIRSLRDGDEPFTREGIAKYFPSQDILEGEHYEKCALVTSAGSLLGSKLGTFIDSHDFIVRLNHAPVAGFEVDVGNRTNLRIINSQIVTKPEFNFWASPLYRNITLLVWDPSNYTASLEQWYNEPDFPFFSEYFSRRLMMPTEKLHLLHPASLWQLWDAMQKYTYSRVRPNPPSSGFLGLVLLMHHCNQINIMEFIPSLRFNKICHYWDAATDIGCTFGDWHPLATEKLTTMFLNTATDLQTYHLGYSSVTGFSQSRCSN